jgi:hypothetical protein
MRLQELLLMLFDSCPGALIHPLLVNDWPFTGICPAIACKVSLPSEAKWNAQKAAFCWHQGLTSALGQGQTQVSWTSSGTGDCQEWLIFNVAKFAVLTINVCFRGHNFSRYHVTLPLLDPSASAWTSPYVEGVQDLKTRVQAAERAVVQMGAIPLAWMDHPTRPDEECMCWNYQIGTTLLLRCCCFACIALRLSRQQKLPPK